MAITSFSYFVFSFFALIGCTLLQSKNEHKKTFLLIISYYFYMTLDWRFAFLLLTLTGVNFAAGHIIANAKKQSARKMALMATITVSLSILFYFKYAGFFVEQVYLFLEMFGVKGKSFVIDVILPIGISFITFQAITYPLDLYSRKLDHTASVKDFALFMAFFPQLLSGPIMRASFFVPQLESETKATGKQMMEGMTFILRGLIKKIMIADILAMQIVDPAFSSPAEYSSLFLVIAIFAFSFQVYMDLGGYTDIAIGIGKILGYKIPVNFNRPYLATSIANYWQRWHITMSSFFRDYLYEAIKDMKWSNIYINLLLVFIAIGIWHGAGWNFVAYGFIHGSLVAYEHMKSEKRAELGLPPIVYRGSKLFLRVIQIFTIVTFTRILFRGEDFSASVDYLTALISPSAMNADLPISIMAGLAFIMAGVLHFTPMRWRDDLTSVLVKLPAIIYAGLAGLLIYIMTAFDVQSTAFIYFQF